MTDEQLITILECCSSDENIKCCKKCALCEKYDCYSEISKNALDLINRQKAEIERLSDYNANLQTANTELSNEIIEIKSEAIKEFAEKLKQKAVIPFPYISNEILFVEDIDEVAKQLMTEENE